MQIQAVQIQAKYVCRQKMYTVQIQAKSSLPYKKFMGFYRERTKCQYLHGTYVAHAHIVYTYAAQGMYVACPPE